MKSSPASRSVLAWAMYDFANSAFATSFLAVIFGVYFANVLVPHEGLIIGGVRIPGESLWGYLISTVMFFVILISPALGSLSDKRGLKRFFLMIMIVIGSITTGILFLATPGRLPFAMVLSFFAILCFELSLVFYNAFLNEITDEVNRGRVSGLGFAVGYVGGGLCLALNMVMMAKPAFFHLQSGDVTLPIRASVGVVGLWWLVFSLPVFFWLFDKPHPSKAPSDVHWATIVLQSLNQLKTTFLHILKKKQLARFLLAFLIYDDGVQTILLMASIFGAKELGLNPGQLALIYLLVQFVAFVGALFWGRVADAWNHKNVIVCTVALFAGITVWAVMVTKPWEFWLLGAVVGGVMGGVQAASRSLFSLMIPPENAGEFFSFFSIIGKATSLVGPFVFGIVSQFHGIRAGVGSLIVFFVLGGAILLTVDEKRGRAEAGL